MIKTIRLRNFQAHKDEIIECGPITSIVGRSDVGKSAVIRAIRWVCLNQPNGSSFIRHGEGECSVSIVVDSGNSHVVRARDRGSDNTYVLDGVEFRSFGLGVPDDVVSVLKVSDINFQMQHDAPFWFSLSPAEVSRRLNSVIDLEVIDSSLANSAALVRSYSSDYASATAELSLSESGSMALAWVDLASEAWSIVVGLRDAFDNSKKRSADLESTYSAATTAHAALSRNRELSSDCRVVGKIGQLCVVESARVLDVSRYIELLRTAKQSSSLYSDLFELHSVYVRLSSTSGNVDALSSMVGDVVLAAKCIELVDRIDTTDIDTLMAQYELASSTYRAAIYAVAEMKRLSLARERAESDLMSATGDMSEFTAPVGACPVCGGPL